MEIRQISAEENIRKRKIQAIAFLFKMDDNGSAAPPEEQTDYSACRAAFDEEGKMCSCLDLLPLEVRFDGKAVKSGGIGGVASLPEERQKKYVRRIFESIMPEMYDSGYAFSYLYPFSHSYYRKFGYELNMLQRHFSIGIQHFKHIWQTGEISMYAGEAEAADVKRLYGEFIRDKNLPVIRTEKLWKVFFEKDAYRDNVYLYIWHNRSGEARGYIKFSPGRVPGSKSNMDVQELIWLDSEAFAGILAFVGGFSAQIDKMLWRAPEFLSLHPFIQEPYELGQEIRTYGMNRIVNAEKALRLMASPPGSGNAVIAVQDDFFPVNSGNYSLSWESGEHSVKKTQAAPDLSCDIQTLSQLVTGFASVDELRFAGRLEVHGSESALSRVFPKKPLFINNYF